VIELVAPTVRLRASWLDAHREWGPGFHEDGFGLLPTDEIDSSAGFVIWVQRLSDASVSVWHRWLVEGDRVLGAVALRYGDGDVVQRVGNVGFGIRPSERRRGLATLALACVIGEALEVGLDRLLLVCEASNVASAKMIEANGGILEGGADSDVVRRYWINIS
jgi:predicted acetyltransferase